ncbi:MAG: sugar phosphate isomerase/epimerase [Bryobacteraceae bacterium]|nr:sugar phosphate isomerase/epimerase [Bryobacteraceae bacterium]MDW8378022.1 sugar phosphate isomerase/epimerase family protein [Bryobacterales bacterium]
MPVLRDLEIGAMFWAGRDSLPVIKALGVCCGQLGIPGDMDLSGAAEVWKKELAEHEFSLFTVFCAYRGESYADIPTVQRTVGFIPQATRAEREARTLQVSDFAAAIGVKSIACHIGFVPEDPSHPDFLAVRDMVRRVCDHARKNGQTFALETGQEPAHTLLRFFQEVDRENLGINFDPANMILYGTGDPIEALDLLAPHVISVHAKDGDWPPKDKPGALGVEQPLGKGSVGVERFVAKLKEIGYKGALNIEREVEDLEQRYADMAAAVALLERLRA